ncbi:SMP-30/gluconolactonase/LRE family protein [Actinoplanes sp. CA-030573]|uniref:SMP-30/gluconolactonase/LRE family protein n=1 Tax=Actinoplanes sp. CA-030573 TaxID=3239898 RepID=UPI003D935F9B
MKFSSLKQVAWDFTLVESPIPDSDPSNPGGLLVCDTLAGGVHRLDGDGTVLEVLLPGRRGIGGLATATGGGFVATGRDVVHVPAAGVQREAQTLLTALPSITGFNDLTVTPDSGLLIGALRFRPLAGEAARSGALVHRPGGRSADASVWDAETLTWPNGLAFSPDYRWLYAADFASGIVYRGRWNDGRSSAALAVMSGDVGRGSATTRSEDRGLIW